NGVESVLPPEQALRQLKGPVVLVGDGVLLYRSLIEKVLGDNFQLPAACHHQPRAAAAAVLAVGLYRADMDLDAARLTPVYIRPSDAELPRLKKV
ncbi:MAG: tRNA (adenosine(37)-N6)-threonylcarbamoyltransferase complex dimerization subunit type 1 TsaB, partial [Geopsychrobacter sp.]|nr:tRNA (adenosine(37)-N6)-threonylcarbamoyltransferase complex dimerization subunit type 1 TsaB [Geopsychrobacter sp.]